MMSFAKKEKISDPKSSGHVRSPSRDQAHDARRRLRACPPRPRTVATMIVVRAASCSHKNCCWCPLLERSRCTPESRVWCSSSQPGLWRKRTRICFSRARVPVDLRRLARDHAVTLPAPQVARFLTLPPLVITSHCNALSASCHNALCLSFLRPFVCVLMCMWLWVTSRSRQSALSTSAVPTSARAPTLSGQALAPTQPSDSMPAMPPRRSCRRATFPWVATALALSCALAACARSVSPPRPSRPAPPCLAPRCCFRA